MILSLQRVCVIGELKEDHDMKTVYYYRIGSVSAGFVLPDEKEAMDQFFEQRIAEEGANNLHSFEKQSSPSATECSTRE